MGKYPKRNQKEKMSEAKVNIDAQEFSKVLKKYKKLKKYMKSNIFELHRLHGSEQIISKLTQEIDETELRQPDEYEGRNNSSISGGSESSFIPCNNESPTSS